jgi:hypothetical protein
MTSLGWRGSLRCLVKELRRATRSKEVPNEIPYHVRWLGRS